MTAAEIPTLADFLLARFAEDEGPARAAIVPAHIVDALTVRPELSQWRYPSRDREVEYVIDDPISSWNVTLGDELPGVSEKCGPHIARHDPARVLAECEAKRRIVEEYEANFWPDPGDREALTDASSAASPAAMIRLLALPYADHPDYREEWHV